MAYDPALLARFVAAHPDVSPAQLQADLQRAYDYYTGLGYDLNQDTGDPSYYVQAALTGNTSAASSLPRLTTAPAPAPAPGTPPASTNNTETPAPPLAGTVTTAPLPGGAANPGTGGTTATGTAGTTVAPTDALAPGAQTPLGPLIGGLPGGLGLDWWTLFAQEMASLMAADGTVRDPRTGQVFTNPDGSPMQTQQALLNAQQIATQQAQLAFQEATLSGTINGVPTLDAQKLQQDAAQFAAQMGLSQQQLAAQISQFGQTLGLQAAQLTGTYNGQQTLAAQQQQFSQQQQAQQATLDQAIARAQQSGTFTDPVTGQSIQTLQAQQQQFAQGATAAGITGYYNGAPTFAAQQYLAQNLADPTRTVQGNYLANLYGTAATGQAGITPAPPTAYGVSPTTGGTAATPSTSPGAYGVNVTVSPELQGYFGGSPTSQPRTGTQGQTMDLGQMSSYAFKQTPSAYRALSSTGQAQLGSYNQALFGQSPQDYQDMIKKQLPAGSNQMPGAYAV